MAQKKRRKPNPKNRFPKRRRGDEPNDLDGLIVHGTFQRTADGHARVSPESGADEVFVPAENFGEAKDGDWVTVRLDVGRKGKVKGKVLRARTGGDRSFVGVVQSERKSFVVYPEPMGPAALIGSADLNGAKARDAVVAEMIGATKSGAKDRARVLEVLGPIDQAKVQVELVIRAQGWPLHFDDDVLAEAEAFDSVDPEKALADPKRRDLRKIPHVTIDGADARDFDDAVHARAEGDRWRVWVSIADVSHYVRPGSALDRCAKARSTSVYFPDRVLPMLPERLSNDLCSLRPHVPRLAMTCEMRVDARGYVDEAFVYPSLIESAG
ncbi:MAG: RNB domain-containing ribonuclease, partial [Myxococcota bacterium]